MERLKSLDPPHKGLRNALSKLALIAGKTNYTSEESVKKLQLISKEVFHLLKDHTATETNSYLVHSRLLINLLQKITIQIMWKWIKSNNSYLIE